MQKPQYHLFLCSSFRANGEPKGVCNRKGLGRTDPIRADRDQRTGHRRHGFDDGLPERLREGPVLVVYPNAWWYLRSGPSERWIRSSTPWRRAAGNALADRSDDGRGNYVWHKRRCLCVAGRYDASRRRASRGRGLFAPTSWPSLVAGRNRRAGNGGRHTGDGQRGDCRDPCRRCLAVAAA